MDLKCNLFDATAIEKYFGGIPNIDSRKLFIQYAAKVILKMDSRIEALEKALKDHSFEKVIFVVHQLKVSLQTAGGPELAELCKKIEENARSGRNIEIQRKIFERLQRMIMVWQVELFLFFPEVSLLLKEQGFRES